MTESARPTALVTGAARGIGRAIAAGLAADGWAVALVDRDPAVRTVAQSLGAPCLAITANLPSRSDIDHAIAAVDANFGRLDGLVNNAGYGLDVPPEQLNRGQWDRVLAVNLTAPFILARQCAPFLRATGGAIVNIASTRALQSEPHSEPYAASKAGLLGLTHALAASFSPQIRVNAISPGWIDSTGPDPESGAWDPDIAPRDHDQHPVGRVGKPGDVAQAVAFLLDGRRSGFMTGENLVLDGGLTRKMIYSE